MNDFETYISPFAWRYSSAAMREIWSEQSKRLLWRNIWLSLAEVQFEFGLVSREQVEDLRTRVAAVDVEKALEIESEIQHDLMAELKAYASQCPVGGGVLHLGATSADIQDNADALRIRQALDHTLRELRGLLSSLAEKTRLYADVAVIGFTHLQPAEPSTLGFRLAQYAQDLFIDWQAITQIRKDLKGKGFRGAVGTSASYSELIGLHQLPAFEARLEQVLGLQFFPVTTQVYPRKQEYQVLCALAGLAASLHKLAFDVRILQSPVIGEISEPFGSKQVGSSAMPFKRNPIRSEKIDSLARHLAQLPRLSWDNAANSLLERTLDDSANRRSLLPQAFLMTDEMIRTAQKIISGLAVDRERINHNLSAYGAFAGTERVLMALVKAGGDRQELHEKLREYAMVAWQAIQSGNPNPLQGLICEDETLNRLVPQDELYQLMDARLYVGDAPKRARDLANTILEMIDLDRGKGKGDGDLDVEKISP